MDFAYTPEQEALREEVRQFIAENITPEMRQEMEDSGIRRRGPKGFLLGGIGEIHSHAAHMDRLPGGGHQSRPPVRLRMDRESILVIPKERSD